MTTRPAAALALAAALSVSLGGCADPGLPTPGIALVTAADGTTSVVSLTCEPASTFELSLGTDLWSEPDVEVELDAPGSRQEISLPAIADSGTVVAGDQQVVDEMSGPFAVRLYGDGGAPVGAVVFDGTPEAGHGSVVLNNGDSEPSEVEAADVARLNQPAC
ncbi:hypothetical protein Cch01nite_20390 [Cellulomonas chitinilytica]|uniref:Lipoprotein n=1 Tax=Cellulomonas chitinilytica TaxID=398759 RepID=A0A919P306_9CELL|nr:hypothetical protein [Cellulomonas chitinilytica]GIG21315.1 hypothetical protein Cch01nite_20390 [Cellulomonas chitinilytica]